MMIDWSFGALARVALFVGRKMAAAGNSLGAVRCMERATILAAKDGRVWREAHEQAAQILQNVGRTHAAIAHLRSLANGHDIQSWRRLAQALHHSHKYEEEAECWRHVLTIDQTDREAHERLAELLCDQGGLFDAVPHFRALAQAAPGQIRPWLRLARILQKTGDREEEAIAWQRVLTCDDAHGEAHSRLALLCEALDRKIEAVPHLRMLARLAPHLPQRWIRLARVMRELGDAEGEVAAWQQVLLINNTHRAAHGRLAFLFQRLNHKADAIPHLRALAEARPGEIGPRIILAKILQEVAAPKVEATAWQEVLTIDRTNREAHGRLAQLLEGRVEAVPHLRALAESAAGQIKPWIRLARALQKLGDADGEILAWRETLTIDPFYPEAHKRLAKQYQSFQRLADAIPHLRVLANASNEVSPKLNFAKAIQGLEDHSAEIAAWKDVLAVQGGHVEAHERLVQLLEEQGRKLEAIPHLRALAEGAGGRIKPWIRLLRSLQEVGDTDAEVAAWQRVLAINNAHTEAHARLIELYQRNDRKRDMIPHLQSLAELTSDSIKLWIRLARAQQDVGEHETAIASWQKVLTLDPSRIEAHKQLVELFRRVDRGQHAIPHLHAIAACASGGLEPSARLAQVQHDAGDFFLRLDTLEVKDVSDCNSVIFGHRRRFVVPVRQPLVLVTQIQRSGGTLITQLLDGHSQLHVHPSELHIGKPKHNWPQLDLTRQYSEIFDELFEKRPPEHARSGYQKLSPAEEKSNAGYRDMILPFIFIESLQRDLFERLSAYMPPLSQREALNHYATAYFNAWIDYKGLYRQPLTIKYWLAFTPRVLIDISNFQKFLLDYPDGRIIVPVREPVSWYASARHHTSEYESIERALKLWLTCNANALECADRHPQMFLFVKFEDLVADTRSALDRITSFLGIRYEPNIDYPTFNEIPIVSDSSFGSRYGIDRSAINRADKVDVEHHRQIRDLAQDIYARLLSACKQ